MPAALTNSNAEAGSTGLSQSAEERKGEAVGSQSTGNSTLSDFKPLQDLHAAVALHSPFAHLKMSEEAESSNQASYGGLANCLRFSPALSSDHVVITENGKCAMLTFSSLSVMSFEKFYCARFLVQHIWTTNEFTGSNQAQIKLVNNNSKLLPIL